MSVTLPPAQRDGVPNPFGRVVSELDFHAEEVGFDSLRLWRLLPVLIMKVEYFWKLSEHVRCQSKLY